MRLLFPSFLRDESEYAGAESHWRDQWNSISEFERTVKGWKAGWFPPQPFKDANPIFSAVSEKDRKGLRIVQYESTSSNVEFDFWLDSFGGDAASPGAIRELVIACALSVESSQLAVERMASWVSGEIRLVNVSGIPGGYTVVVPFRPQWLDPTPAISPVAHCSSII